MTDFCIFTAHGQQKLFAKRYDEKVAMFMKADAYVGNSLARSAHGFDHCCELCGRTLSRG